METQRDQLRIDNGYKCRLSLVFTDIDPNKSIDTPAEGELKATLGDSIPHPVEIGIENISDEAGNASYVEFEKRTKTIDNPNRYPAVFSFITNSSSGKGGKWYYYKTADWTPNSDIETYEDAEFVKHHVAIPSSQKIRLIHRILNGNAKEDTITDIIELYNKNKKKAVSEFSDDIKGHVGFESRAEIQNFLIEYTEFHRSHSNAVNKVAKQLVKKELRHRVQSIEDVQIMVEKINSLENFPNITTEDVFKRVIKRSDKPELEEIANHLDLEDWSLVLSK
jgi:hypothetical protein